MKSLNTFIKNVFNERGEKVKKIERMKTSGNVTSLVFTEKGRYVLRLSDNKWKQRTREEIESEVKLLKFLCSNSIPVPDPMEVNDEFVVSFDRSNGILYRHLDAEPVKVPNLYNCLVVGETLAKIHKLTENFKFPFKRREWDLKATEKTFKEMKERFHKNPYFRKYNFAGKIQLVLNGLKFPNNLPECVVHEDLGKRHVLFKGVEIHGILDFDRSYFGPSVLDLGQAARGWCFDNWKTWDKDKFKFLIRGYESRRKLTELEKRCLVDSIRFGILERVVSYGHKFVCTKNKADAAFAVHSLNLIHQIKLS